MADADAETQVDPHSGVHLVPLVEEQLVAALRDVSKRHGGQTSRFSCRRLSPTLFQASAVVQLTPGSTAIILGPCEATTYERAVEELLWVVLLERNRT